MCLCVRPIEKCTVDEVVEDGVDVCAVCLRSCVCLSLWVYINFVGSKLLQLLIFLGCVLETGSHCVPSLDKTGLQVVILLPPLLLCLPSAGVTLVPQYTWL